MLVLVFMLSVFGVCSISTQNYQQSKELVNQDHQKEDPEHAYIAFCILVRDAFRDELREWILYHKYIGVGKIYMFDDFSNSSRPMLSLVHDFIESGLVSYFYLGQMHKGVRYRKNDASKQTHVYNRCLHWFGKQHTFLGFIDHDEFVVLRDEYNNVQSDFKEFLKPVENYGGLVLYWRLFGSSGHTYHQKSTLQSYTKCERSIDKYDHLPEPRYLGREYSSQNYKSIVNTKQHFDTCVVHDCYSNRTFVNAEMQELPSGYPHRMKYFTWNRAFLHHYRLKSKEDFFIKVNRGHANNFRNLPQQTLQWSFFNYIDNITTANCQYMIEIAQNCYLIIVGSNYSLDS
eukprot:TRINITY_DN3336_c1_g2_i1.p1 TRINITY_DN3336_c1_g2~~TRINITY_DN3336_c1_g2_i1.p1  ORF type:complete len:344 (+),score=-1.76 TRINITY_DN3336_c1_g2_i1:126-1157(+)